MAAAFSVGWGRRRKRSRDLPAQYGGERYLRKLLSFDPLALWPLRGDGYDRSGNGYHGSSVNAVFEAGSGVDGRAALYFNGSTAYFDVYSAALAAMAALAAQQLAAMPQQEAPGLIFGPMEHLCWKTQRFNIILPQAETPVAAHLLAGDFTLLCQLIQRRARNAQVFGCFRDRH